MKTLMIFTDIGNGNVEFFHLEGDRRDLHNSWINKDERGEKLGDEMFNDNGVLLLDPLPENAIDNFKSYDFIITCGMVP